MTETFTSMKQFREYFFPNMCEEEREPKGIIIILLNPGV